MKAKYRLRINYVNGEDWLQRDLQLEKFLRNLDPTARQAKPQGNIGRVYPGVMQAMLEVFRGELRCPKCPPETDPRRGLLTSQHQTS